MPIAFRASLLKAHSVAYVSPAAGGTSGTYFEGLLKRFGIYDQMKNRIVYRNQGSEVADAVAGAMRKSVSASSRSSAPNKGVKIADHCRTRSNPTDYVAGVTTVSASPDAARALVNAMTSPSAGVVFKAAGLTVLSRALRFVSQQFPAQPTQPWVDVYSSPHAARGGLVMDPIRRQIIATGAAATAVAAAPGVFAAQNAPASAGTAFFEKGPVRTHFEDQGGTAFPLLCIPGGGLDSVLASLHGGPFDPFREFAGDFRCISQDLRNANAGQSAAHWKSTVRGIPHRRPARPHGSPRHQQIHGDRILHRWSAVWNLLKRAPDRVVAAVLAQPSGFRPEMPTLTYDGNMTGWGPELVKRRRDLNMDMVHI